MKAIMIAVFVSLLAFSAPSAYAGSSIEWGNGMFTWDNGHSELDGVLSIFGYTWFVHPW